LEFQEPAPMPRLSYTEDGRTVEQPALLSGVFRSQEGELAIFVVNISGHELPFLSDVDLARRGLSAGITVDVSIIAPQGTAEPYAQGVRDRISVRGHLPARYATMFRLVPRR